MSWILAAVALIASAAVTLGAGYLLGLIGLAGVMLGVSSGLLGAVAFWSILLALRTVLT